MIGIAPFWAGDTGETHPIKWTNSWRWVVPTGVRVRGEGAMVIFGNGEGSGLGERGATGRWRKVATNPPGNALKGHESWLVISKNFKKTSDFHTGKWETLLFLIPDTSV